MLWAHMLLGGPSSQVYNRMLTFSHNLIHDQTTRFSDVLAHVSCPVMMGKL